MEDIRSILKRRTEYYLEDLMRKEGLKHVFKGVWIPKEIWETDLLNALEKVLLTEIAYLDEGEGCYASNEYFSKFLGVSERRVRQMINKLKKLGLAKQVKFDGRKRYLKATITMCVKTEGKNSREEKNFLSHRKKISSIENRLEK